MTHGAFGFVGCVLLDLGIIALAAVAAVLMYRYGGSSFGFGPVLRWLIILGVIGVAAWAGWSIYNGGSCANDWLGWFILGCGIAAGLTSFVVSRLLQRERDRIARVAAEQGIEVDVSQVGKGPDIQLRALAHGVLSRLAEKVRNK